jgi:hypothetical protein
MLTIVVPGVESFDEANSRITTVGDMKLQLEHSLVSLSKWEQEWEEPFLTKKDKTSEQTMSYIRAMTLTPDVPPEVYSRLTPENFAQIQKHIEAKMTATWFNDTGSKPSREILTAEIIYYWMFSLGIPLECENWHLNRLLTLVRVFDAKNQKNNPNRPKPSSANLAAERMRLNAERRKQLNSRG